MFGILGLIQRTTHVIFEPLDFIAGLAPLVPKPRVNLPGCPGHPGHLDRGAIQKKPLIEGLLY